MEEPKKIIRWSFAAAFILLGLILNYFNIGMNNRLGFGSIGNWMFFVGLIVIMMNILKSFQKKKRVVDERMSYLSWKAARVTYLVFIFATVAIMIIDAINPISIPIYMLMNYMLCGFLLVHIVSYRILLRYN